MRAISAAVDIAATPQHVWAVLADLDSYPQWNPFIRSASGQLAEGATLTLRLLPAQRPAMTFRLPGYWKLLQAELAAMGKSPGDIRALILTHGDTDHIGFAARLHREAGVAAYIHEADVDRARLKVKKPNSGWGPVKIGPLAGFLWYSARRGGLRPRPAPELQSIAHGDGLDAPASPPVLHTPRPPPRTPPRPAPTPHPLIPRPP